MHDSGRDLQIVMRFITRTRQRHEAQTLDDEIGPWSKVKLNQDYWQKPRRLRSHWHCGTGPEFTANKIMPRPVARLDQGLTKQPRGLVTAVCSSWIAPDVLMQHGLRQN